MRHVGPAFEDIRRGDDRVSSRGPKILRVHCAPSFAAQWLTPRLPGFLSRHPDIEIRLSAGIDYTRFVNDEFDVDIVYGRPSQEVSSSCRLARRRSRRSAHPSSQPHSQAGGPAAPRLIDSGNKKVRWPDWFAANGLTASPPMASFSPSFSRSPRRSAASASRSKSTRLAEREIANGSLVPILAGKAQDVHYVGHFLVFPRLALRRQTLRVFMEWITRELKIDTQSPIVDEQKLCRTPTVKSIALETP